MNKAIIALSMFAIFAMLTMSCNKTQQNEDMVTLTDENFDTETAKGIVLVDFWASWCVPCKAMAPVIDEIASQTKGKIKVGKVDVDANGRLSNKYGIQAIPTILIFKDGQVVETLVGVQSKASIINALSKYTPLQ